MWEGKSLDLSHNIQQSSYFELSAETNWFHKQLHKNSCQVKVCQAAVYDKKQSNNLSYHWLLFFRWFQAVAESELSKLRFDRVSLACRRHLQIAFLKWEELITEYLENNILGNLKVCIAKCSKLRTLSTTKFREGRLLFVTCGEEIV